MRDTDQANESEFRSDDSEGDENLAFSPMLPISRTKPVADETSEFSILFQIVLMIAGVSGPVIGIFVGWMLVVPTVLMLFSIALLVLVVRGIDRAIMPACALQMGQGLWILISGLPNKSDAVMVMVVIGHILFALWLAYRPSILPAMAIGAFQFYAISVNFIHFEYTPAQWVEHKALILHMFLRSMTMLMMVAGLVEIDQAKKWMSRKKSHESNS